MAKSNAKHKQLRYLSQSVRLEEAVTPHLVHRTITILCMTVIGFIVWGYYTKIDELASGEGEIVPKGFQQLVQHLEGGIISDIHVKEGALVEEGQLLVTLDDSADQNDLKRALLKKEDQEIQLVRFQAALDGTEPNFDQYAQTYPDLVKEQLEIYRSMMDTKKNEKQVLIEQIDQKENTIKILEGQLQTAKNNREIMRDLYEKRKYLNKEGVVPEVRYLETKQRLNDVEGEVERITNQIAVAKLSIREFKQRLNSVEAKNKDELIQKLDKVSGDLAQTNEVVEKLTSKVTRMNVRAPVKGYVKGLSVNTVGGVVQPGQVLMEIVPLEAELIAQMRINPEHIGHVQKGDPVKLKFSTYDFSVYGAVDGTLQAISATTFIDETGNSYYQGLVSFDKKYVGDDSKNLILPGMTLAADIVTGDRSILEYLFKPIHLSLKSAFTER